MVRGRRYHMALGVLGLMSLATAAYAACSDQIRRLADGMIFTLEHKVEVMEGELAYEGLGFKWTLWGGEVVSYGKYHGADGSILLIQCDDIGVA